MEEIAAPVSPEVPETEKLRFGSLPFERVLEALLFASDQPLTRRKLRDIFRSESRQEKAPEGPPLAELQQTAPEESRGGPPAPAIAPKGGVEKQKTPTEEVDEMISSGLRAIQAKYSFPDSPVVVLELAEGWQLATNPQYAPWIKKLYKDRNTFRLSQAALETLAIVSYKQPITRAEIEEIRGVESIASLETLLEKNLIKAMGRKETVGRPLLYATAPEFLRQFGLRTLEDLPPMENFADAADILRPEAGEQQSMASSLDTPQG